MALTPWSTLTREAGPAAVWRNWWKGGDVIFSTPNFFDPLKGVRVSQPPTPFRYSRFPSHPLLLGFQGARRARERQRAGSPQRAAKGKEPAKGRTATATGARRPLPAVPRREPAGAKNYLDVIFPALSGVIGGRKSHFGCQKNVPRGPKK